MDPKEVSKDDCGNSLSKTEDRLMRFKQKRIRDISGLIDAAFLLLHVNEASVFRRTIQT